MSDRCPRAPRTCRTGTASGSNRSTHGHPRTRPLYFAKPLSEEEAIASTIFFNVLSKWFGGWDGYKPLRTIIFSVTIVKEKHHPFRTSLCYGEFRPPCFSALFVVPSSGQFVTWQPPRDTLVFVTILFLLHGLLFILQIGPHWFLMTPAFDLHPDEAGQGVPVQVLREQVRPGFYGNQTNITVDGGKGSPSPYPKAGSPTPPPLLLRRLVWEKNSRRRGSGVPPTNLPPSGLKKGDPSSPPSPPLRARKTLSTSAPISRRSLRGENRCAAVREIQHQRPNGGANVVFLIKAPEISVFFSPEMSTWNFIWKCQSHSRIIKSLSWQSQPPSECSHINQNTHQHRAKKWRTRHKKTPYTFCLFNTQIHEILKYFWTQTRQNPCGLKLVLWSRGCAVSFYASFCVQ